ncbi:hypothetical protein BH24DEI2_BH24DEI2_10720 [soil metagenome]
MRKITVTVVAFVLLSAAWALAQPEPPLNDTFESELVSVPDDFGNDVGFVTWGDAPGNVTLERLEVPADSELALPDQDGVNHVLELTRNVSSWGGFTHAFETDGAWVGRDLSAYEGLSFRYYGTGNGETVFVEMFDNRSGPQGDSAERYESSFQDDFMGWDTLEVPFTDFRRRGDFQPAGAPNDGLGLTEASGYAFRYGASDTPVYLDDVLVYGSVETAAPGDDTLQVSFSRPSFEAREGEPATLTVRLNRAAEEPVSVRYTSAPETATRYRDYAGGSDLVVFAPGVTEQTFTVATLPDSKHEGDETLQLGLESPYNVALGTQRRTTLFIRDDDPLDPTLLEDFGDIQDVSASNMALSARELPADADMALPDQDLYETVLKATWDAGAANASFGRSFAKPQDLSGGEGVSFWYYGSGSGQDVTLELQDGASEGAWEPVYEDDFDGAAGTPPDPAVWSADIGDGTVGSAPGWGNNELEYYTDAPENVALDGAGNLVITARETAADARLTCYYGPCRYTSARLKTLSKLEVTYGRIEARMQLPAGQGVWPALWLLGDASGGSWPNAGEIDIVENIGREPSTVHGTVHGPGYSGASGVGGSFELDGATFADDFHTFALEWRPNELKWFVDDELFFTLTPDDLPAGSEWVFDHPYYLLLNLAVGGSWPGNPDETTAFPQALKVDYLHVYSAADTAERFSTTFTDDFTGWQKVTLPFADFARGGEQPAGAPDDGLGLTSVTGYRFELPQASGGTLYLDALRSVRSLSGEVYLDPAQSLAVRVADLLSQMTLAEKVGQMTQIDVTRLMGTGEWDRGPLNEEWLQRILVDYHVGSLLSGGGAAPVPNTPRDWAEMTNTLQRYALEHSRLPIPLIYGIDAVHGHNNVLGATIYPHNVGLAATFDPELVEELSRRVADDLLATGTPWSFAPVTDLGRDPRWGRFYETFGEDPVLAADLVTASVRGFQASGKVAATVKHFGGYSQALVGFDRSPAFLDTRTLCTVHFPAARAGLNAGADTVMANSGSVNGVPVHASEYLLTDVLRDEFGFGGVTVSDWNDIDKLVTLHKVAADFGDAVAMSINAGVDMYMVPHDADTFTSTLTDLVTEGTVAETRIDEAVGRILALKFKLGLFEQPYVDADAADAIVIEQDRALARRAAAESLTLLENGPLPFDETVENILVVGDSADSLKNQTGGWTLGWQGLGDSGETPPGTTVLDALQNEAPEGVTVDYLGTTRDSAALTAAAGAADIVVAVVGEPPYAEGEGDSATLALADGQLELLRTLTQPDTPVVVVLMAGRPLIIPEDVQTGLASLVMAYLPGSEGGPAVADLLYGRISPGGRLPFSWPRHTGQLPLTYDVLPGAPYDPLYAFGTGLSYTRFKQSKLSAELSGDTVNVNLELANSGDHPGSETVQVYVSRPPAGVLTPNTQLVGFARVRLEPGKQRTVTVTIPVERLAVVPGDVLGQAEAVVVPGLYTLTVGTATTRLELP